jgi:predicted glutamine amidotransferase
MCIIAVVPAGKTISEEELNNCWDSNGDGGGFAYAQNGVVKIRKGFMTKEEFMRSLKSLMAKHGASTPFVIHFRIRTHGLTDKERTHPFRLPDGSALAHNGVLRGADMYDATKSDTQLFIEKYGTLLTKEILEREKLVIGKAIGYNKFAIIHPDASLTIVNESIGQWHEGRWFSNGSYRGYYSMYGNLAK